MKPFPPINNASSLSLLEIVMMKDVATKNILSNVISDASNFKLKVIIKKSNKISIHNFKVSQTN